MGALLALFAAAAWGSGDYLGASATRRHSSITVTASAQSVGLVLLAVGSLIVGGEATADNMVWPGIGGAAGAAGLLLLYHGLAHGKISVIAPISGVVGAAIPVVWGVADGEELAALRGAGLLAGLVAIAMISNATDDPGQRNRFSARGSVVVGVSAGVLFGAFIVCLNVAGDNAGLYPVLAARSVAVPLLILLALSTRHPVLPRVDRRLVFGAGILDATANVCLLLALDYSLVVAGVLSSLYPAVTVGLARVLRGDHLARVQSIGLLVGAASVVMVTAG